MKDDAQNGSKIGGAPLNFLIDSDQDSSDDSDSVNALQLESIRQ